MVSGHDSDLLASTDISSELSDLSKYGHLNNIPNYAEYKSTIKLEKKIKPAVAARKRTAKKRVSKQAVSKSATAKQWPANNEAKPGLAEEQPSSNKHNKPVYLAKRNDLGVKKTKSAKQRSWSGKGGNDLRLRGILTKKNGFPVYTQYRGDIDIPREKPLRNKPFDLSVKEYKYHEYKLTAYNSSGFDHSVGSKISPKRPTGRQLKTLSASFRARGSTPTAKRRCLIKKVGGSQARYADPLVYRRPRSVVYVDPLANHRHGASNGLYKNTEYRSNVDIPRYRQYKSRLMSAHIRDPRLTTLDSCSIGHGKRRVTDSKPRKTVPHVPAKFKSMSSVPLQAHVSNNITTNNNETQQLFKHMGAEINNLEKNNYYTKQTIHINKHNQVPVDLQIEAALDKKFEEQQANPPDVAIVQTANLSSTQSAHVSTDSHSDIDVQKVKLTKHKSSVDNVKTASRSNSVIYVDDLHVELVEKQSASAREVGASVDVGVSERTTPDLHVETVSVESQQPQLVATQLEKPVVAQQSELAVVSGQPQLVKSASETEPHIDLVLKQAADSVSARQDLPKPNLKTVHLIKLEMAQQSVLPEVQPEIEHLEPVVMQQHQPALVTGTRLDHVTTLPLDLTVTQHTESVLSEHQPHIVKQHSSLHNNPRYSPTQPSDNTAAEVALPTTSSSKETQIFPEVQIEQRQIQQEIKPLQIQQEIKPLQTQLPIDVTVELGNQNRASSAQTTRQLLSSEEDVRPVLASQQNAAAPRSDRAMSLPDISAPNVTQHHDIAGCVTPTPVRLSLTPVDRIEDTGGTSGFSNMPPQGNNVTSHSAWASPGNNKLPPATTGKQAAPRTHAKDKSAPRLVFDFSVEPQAFLERQGRVASIRRSLAKYRY